MVIKKSKSKNPVPKGLIPLNRRSKEEQFKIQSAGGKANKNNPNSKLAARLRELKKKGLNKESERWLYDMMTDSEMAAMRILEYIYKLQAESNGKPGDINAAVKTTMDWFKIKHGTRENDRKVAMAIAVLTPEEKEKEIERLLILE